MKLPHVLSHEGEVKLDLEQFRADELKKAARFWVGKQATTANKTQNYEWLQKALSDDRAVQKAAESLSTEEKDILGILLRYGPVISGELFTVEAEQRGLIEKVDPKDRYLYRRSGKDRVEELCSKLLVTKARSYSYYSSFYGHRYSDLALGPLFVKGLEPVQPLPWNPSETPKEVRSTFVRTSAEPALDMWRVAEGLREMGNWKALKDNTLSKGAHKKLQKLVELPDSEADELSPPDPQALYYILLLELEFLSVGGATNEVRFEKLDEHFNQPPEAQAWYWLRAWVQFDLWQDGIGAVTERYNDHDPDRLDSNTLLRQKELLVWALGRIAASPLDWLDLETFLNDFWTITESVSPSSYWSAFAWAPDFGPSGNKYNIPTGPERTKAFWLDSEGTWLANAIMVTLATLGLIERGETTDKKPRPCFRLTKLGTWVLNTPDVKLPEQKPTKPFLTVQANFDILAYFADADAQRISQLAKFAKCGDSSGGRVQPFSLTRDSVYAALENGLTVEEIEAFLVTEGKTELPGNIRRELQHWAGKRESMVLRTGVTVALATDAKRIGKLKAPARAVTETVAVLPPMSAKKATETYSDWTVVDHLGELPHVWTVEELGTLKSSGTDLISECRLSCLAEKTKGEWLISEKSISQAKQQGFLTDQVLSWLTDHLTHETPPLLATTIRNWNGRTKAFIGSVQMLQVTRAEARDAILQSAAFQPLLAGHIPPDWFIVRDDKVKEIQKLLNRLGFILDDSF